MSRFDRTRPLYLQIVGEIRRRAVRGQYLPGAKLPSVRELSREMGVNPNTVARAYTKLEHEGLIETRRGLGSFLVESTQRIEKERERLALVSARRFLVDIDRLGLDTAQLRTILQNAKENRQG